MRIKKVNGKKIWSFVLAMAMVIGILTQIAMPVQAVEPPAPVYAVLTKDVDGTDVLYEAEAGKPTVATTTVIDKMTVNHLYVANDVIFTAQWTEKNTKLQERLKMTKKLLFLAQMLS